MQLILSVIVLIGCSYLGYGLGNHYVKRHRFIADLIAFANHLKVEIAFSKESLKSIINSHINEFSSDFKSVLKTYLKLLKSNDYITIQDLDENINTIYVEGSEKVQMLQFFNNLGKSDCHHQVETIEKFLVYFNSFLKEANVQKHKYTGMLKKLGFLTGVFIVIVIL
jgi:stage III sporulation protein AB